MSILNTTQFRVERKKHGTADLAYERKIEVEARGFTNDEDRKKKAEDEQRRSKKVQKPKGPR